VGDRILHGGLAYRDAFDQKPPGIHYVYAGLRASRLATSSFRRDPWRRPCAALLWLAGARIAARWRAACRPSCSCCL
jgi:hypothetical protein